MSNIKTIFVAFASALLAGCSLGSDNHDQPSNDGSRASQPDAQHEFVEKVNGYLANAKRSGATSEQIAILEQAEASAEVSIEDYEASVDATLDCLHESGADALDNGMIESEGLSIRQYGVPVSAEESHPRAIGDGVTIHRCVAEHSYWIEIAYQLQPSSREVRQEYREGFREELLECYSSRGFEVDEHGDITELMELGMYAYESDTIDANCLAEIGY
ncbi:hypothetical protein [Haloechinothrix sp. LS1_15]|uniref:hypothetical protein n=1 Tax=Haloechinothrix sp. LS1_15 TaxID=2652248 RepID=UPI0029475382|nr:hypothetical protein [Haloechinothrix sp. LS1_15]MDV6014023.1 hypothetical protein [Haloechinothrix sp. LS1_15]